MNAWQRRVGATLVAIISFAAVGGTLMDTAARDIAAQNSVPSSTGIIGWLQIEPVREGTDGARLAVTGRAFAPSEVAGRYTLDIRRRSKAGASTARQSGAFNISSGEAVKLSHTAVNVLPADQVEIELKLYVGEEMVFTATARTPAALAEHKL